MKKYFLFLRKPPCAPHASALFYHDLKDRPNTFAPYLAGLFLTERRRILRRIPAAGRTAAFNRMILAFYVNRADVLHTSA